MRRRPFKLTHPTLHLISSSLDSLVKGINLVEGIVKAGDASLIGAMSTELKVASAATISNLDERLAESIAYCTFGETNLYRGYRVVARFVQELLQINGLVVDLSLSLPCLFSSQNMIL